MGHTEWMGTEEVARRLGMSAVWVRRQIVAGRLKATAYSTSPARPTYRIAARDLAEFRARYGRAGTEDA